MTPPMLVRGKSSLWRFNPSPPQENTELPHEVRTLCPRLPGPKPSPPRFCSSDQLNPSRSPRLRTNCAVTHSVSRLF